MLWGQGGAAGRHHVGEPGLVGGDDVDVRLNDDCLTGFGDRLVGEVHAVEQRPFLVEVGFEGVEVFGSVAAEKPAGEASRRPGGVVDGEDQSASHPVVEPLRPGPIHDTGFDQDLVGEAFAAEGVGHRLPRSGCVAELPPAGCFITDTALIEVFDPRRLVRLAEQTLVDRGRSGQDLGEVRTVGRVPGRRCSFSVASLEARGPVDWRQVGFEAAFRFQPSEDVAGTADDPVGGCSHLVDVTATPRRHIRQAVPGGIDTQPAHTT
jgi:hypothetical protein